MTEHHDGIIPLEPESPAAELPPRPCPGCTRPMPADAVVCISCGYNRKTGFRPSAGAGASATRPGATKCPSCGYSLVGLKEPRCPECGTQVLPKTVKERIKDDHAALQRSYWIKPTIMAGVGWLLPLVLAGVLAPAQTGDLLLSAALLAASGLAGYTLAAIVTTGFHIRADLAYLTMFGILGIVNLVGGIASIFAGGIITLVGMSLVLVYLLEQMMDLDHGEAIVVAAITIIGQMGLLAQASVYLGW